jgi:hypothetical protein
MMLMVRLDKGVKLMMILLMNLKFLVVVVVVQLQHKLEAEWPFFLKQKVLLYVT